MFTSKLHDAYCIMYIIHTLKPSITVSNIIESVDSICRDSPDTQYMLTQTNSQNLQNS